MISHIVPYMIYVHICPFTNVLRILCTKLKIWPILKKSLICQRAPRGYYGIYLQFVYFKNCPQVPSFILVQKKYSNFIYEFGGGFFFLMAVHFRHDLYDVIFWPLLTLKVKQSQIYWYDLLDTINILHLNGYTSFYV